MSLTTGAATLILMTKDFDPITETAMHPQEFGERKWVFPTASYSTNFSYCTCTFSQQLSEKLHQSLDWQYGIQFPCVKDPWGRISCFLNPHCRAICRLPSIKTCFYGCFWMYFQVLRSYANVNFHIHEETCGQFIHKQDYSYRLYMKATTVFLIS